MDNVVIAMEKEETEKKGSNLMAQYASYQINKVPTGKQDIKQFPKLYKMFIDDQDYERQEFLNEEATEAGKVKPLNQREERISADITMLRTQHSSVL